MKTCSSGKRIYTSATLAEEALLEAQARGHFQPGKGPVNVYLCDTCSNYHLTSRGPMHDKLKEAIEQGSLARMRQAHAWEQKLKRR